MTTPTPRDMWDGAQDIGRLSVELQTFHRLSQSQRKPLLALSHLRHLSPNYFRSIYRGVHAHSAQCFNSVLNVNNLRFKLQYPMYPALHRPAPLLIFSSGSSSNCNWPHIRVGNFCSEGNQCIFMSSSMLHLTQQFEEQSQQRSAIIVSDWLVTTSSCPAALRQFLRIFKWQTTEIISK